MAGQLRKSDPSRADEVIDRRCRVDGRATTVLACFLWFGKGHKALRAEYPVEYVAVSAYLIFFACYNYPWVAEHWPRFAVPAIPFLLYGVKGVSHTRRRVIWPLVVLSGFLGSVGQVSFQDVFGFRLHSLLDLVDRVIKSVSIV